MAGLTAELQAKGVDFVRFLWCDSANVLRAKVVPIGYLREVYERGVGISYAQQGVPVVRDAFVPESGLGPVGEARLVGDWSSLLVLPYSPGHARVIGDMMVDGKAWAHCPRAFLRKMIERAAGLGLRIKAAFENEFYLMKQDADGIPQPLDETLFCSVYGLNQNMNILTQLISNLTDQGSRVCSFHPESGGGQFEIAVHHADPMRAADQQITFRETVHAVAHQNGLSATFLPKPFPDRAGSGCHIHLSLWREGKNITDVESEDLTSRHFSAGILKHLPALMALTTPSNNSFARLGRHLWSGGFACWGYDNREAALRMPTSPAGVTHFELKTHDATANPYLALGGIIAAGLDGVESMLPLPEPAEIDPGLMDAKTRKSKKIEELPTKLKSVLDNLKTNTVLSEALGPELTRSYLAVKGEELASISKLSPAEEVALLVHRY